MLTRLAVLANSFKEGGRCLAGVEVDNQNTPIILNGRPKWIRPVYHTPHGEVPTHLVSHLKVWDVIEMEVTGHPNTDYQRENALFRESSLCTVGSFQRGNVSALCENPLTIFNNRGNAVSQEAIGSLRHSLVLIRTDNFEVVEKDYEDTRRSQLRLLFYHRETQYNLPITDPVFLHRYQTAPDFMDYINELHLCLSLGIVWQDWYYKLVASIIF